MISKKTSIQTFTLIFFKFKIEFTSLIKLVTLSIFLPTGFSRRIVVEFEAPYLAVNP